MRTSIFLISILFILVLNIFLLVKYVNSDIKIFETNIYSVPCIKKNEDGFEVCKSTLFQVDSDFVLLPNGFKSKLDIIPGWYQGVADLSQQNILPSAMILSFLYDCPGELTREEADAIFYRLLISQGVSEYVAGKMHFAVRSFGGNKFNYEKKCYPNEENYQWMMAD